MARRHFQLVLSAYQSSRTRRPPDRLCDNRGIASTCAPIDTLAKSGHLAPPSGLRSSPKMFGEGPTPLPVGLGGVFFFFNAKLHTASYSVNCSWSKKRPVACSTGTR